MITLDQFIAKYDGKPIDFDHQFGNQCVDLVAQYCVEVLGVQPYYANAADWWNYNDDKFAAKIPIGSGETPQKGDIVIWGHNTPGSGGAGHIDIWLDGTRNNFTGFDQNWPSGSYCHHQGHDYNYIIGWYRPKGANMDKVDQNASKQIQFAFLGRNGLSGRAYALDGSTGYPWVGADLNLKLLDDIFNSPEAKQYRDSQDANSIPGINKRLQQGSGGITCTQAERDYLDAMYKIVKKG